MTIITDEMVEKAWIAAKPHPYSREQIRAALEAVEPMIRKHYATLAREWITNNDPSFIEFITEMNAIRVKGLQ